MAYSKEELSQMSPKERQQVYRECQKQAKDVGKRAGDALKNEVHKSGVIGTIFKVALAILLGGK